MKLTRQENWHVKAYPGYLPKGSEIRYCQDIVDEIHKHCDSVASSEIDCDTTEYCEFCGNSWEEESNGEPLCCEAAVVDWERSKYCYQCFQETGRYFKREGNDYIEHHEPIRCKRCKRWFCWECFDYRSHDLCKDCQEAVEAERIAAEHKKRFKGRRVLP